MRRIMILGGSATQLPLIIAANELGYESIVCDFDGGCIGKKYAKKFCQINIVDKENVLMKAQELNIDGIISNSEVAMIIVAYVAQTLGLVGNSVSSIECLNNKYLFRKLQKITGLYTPQTYSVNSLTEIYEHIDKMNFPIIVKPTKTSGSRGITKIEKKDIEAINNAYIKCKEISRNDIVNIEEYVEMPSRKVIEGDIFISNGNFWWGGLFNTYRSKYAPMVPMHYSMPVDVSVEVSVQIKNTLMDLFNAAGIKHGEYNVELYPTIDGEIFIIEINARQGGHEIPEYISLQSGVDMHKLLVSTAVGDYNYWNEIREKDESSRFVSKYTIFSRQSGILKEIFIDPDIKSYIIGKSSLKEAGSFVNACSEGSDNLGFITLEYRDVVTQKNFDENIERYIYPIVEKVQ